MGIEHNSRARLKICKNTILPIPKEHEWSISIAFTGHDGSITIAKGRQVLEVLELERFFNSKNFDFSVKKWKDATTHELCYFDKNMINVYLNQLVDYISRKYTDIFDYGIFVQRNYVLTHDDTVTFELESYFNIKQKFFYSHHMAHATGVFYQSPYKKSLVISFDGGSPDGTMNFFIYDRDGDVPIFITDIQESLGKEYPRYGNLFADIKFTNFNHSLVYPGKIMGLAGYGKPLLNHLEDFKDTFKVNSYKYKLFFQNHYDKFMKIMKIIGKDNIFYEMVLQPISVNREKAQEKYKLKKSDRLTGKLQYDVAATVQLAFEEYFLEIAMPIILEHSDLPICLSGGCALNIILNTRLVEQYGLKVFVSPNPTDCGLSFGGMMALLKPQTPCDNPYLGTELLDRDLLTGYLYENVGLTNSNYDVVSKIDQNLDILSKHITKGKIIGIARGKSEIGPRALGNRSIVCSVAISDMKDRINSKVKGREWFRPFAPIVRLESLNKFFYWNTETRYMSFCPKVREEYLDKIKPVVHVDGTARVQTITREQNQFMYDLLTEMEKNCGYDMLLNTSFNVDGKPIISSVKDAFEVLRTTELDGIVIDNVLIIKRNNKNH